MLFHMQEKLRFAFEANQRESESAIRFTSVKLNSALDGSETAFRFTGVELNSALNGSETAIRFTSVELNSALNGSETTRKRISDSLYRGEIKIIYDFFIYHETF